MEIKIYPYEKNGPVESMIEISFESGFVYERLHHPGYSLDDYIEDAEYCESIFKKNRYLI